MISDAKLYFGEIHGKYISDMSTSYINAILALCNAIQIMYKVTAYVYNCDICHKVNIEDV